MHDYKTRKEAEEMKESSARAQLDMYCPLICNKCRQDCECFYFGRIWEPSGAIEPVFRLTPACCGNAMFSGERN